jgi:hypothetical protein
MPLITTLAGASVRGYGGLKTFGVPNSYQSIETVYLSSGSQSTITFSSIPSTYKHLQLRGFSKSSGPSDINFRLNGDSGSNYSRHYIYGNGVGPTGSGSSANSAEGYVGYTASGTYFSGVIIDILDYKNTNKYKLVRTWEGVDTNNAGDGIVMLNSSCWQNTAAITSISLTYGSGSFSQYTHFALYGIKGA